MIRLLQVVLIGLVALVAAASLHAQTDPFTGKPTESGEPQASSQILRAAGPLAVIGRAFLTFQRESNR